MSISAILGLQWGDEGKAKVVDVLTADADVVVRFQGGANAGHTVKVGETEFIFHLVPSGMIYPDTLCVIGNGAVIDPEQLFREIDDLALKGVNVGDRLRISDRAHVVFPYHKELDELREKAAGKGQIGTTKRGIGPAYGDKVSRVGLRTRDLLDPDFGQLLKRSLDEKNAVIEKVYGGTALSFRDLHDTYREYGERLRPMLCDTGLLLHQLDGQDKQILFEGAQGTMLDIDHGTYPFVTSSNTIGPNMFTGAGYCPRGIGAGNASGENRIIGVVKAYTTRVGAGPFPTELPPAEAETLRSQGGEFGATTGRPRRCGWLDVAQVRYATRLSGATEIFLTKLDVLTGLDPIRVGIAYRGLEAGTFPASLRELDDLEVEWQALPGWTEDITGCRRYADLPANARRYVEAVESLIGVPVRTISVGPKRSEVVTRD